jgi:copper binding protein CusF
LSRRAAARRLVVVLFIVLVALFAAGLWGTVVRPAAYEVRGELVARAAPDLILVRHQPITGLGMGAMEMMAVRGSPAVLDAAQLTPGDRVRLAVRQDGDEVSLVWIERVR